MASPGNPNLQNQNQQFPYPLPSSSASSPPPYPLPSSSYPPLTGPSYPFHHAHFLPYPSTPTPTPTPPDHHFHHHQLPLPNLYRPISSPNPITTTTSNSNTSTTTSATPSTPPTPSTLPRPSSSADAIDAEAPSQAVGEDAVEPAEAARNGGVNHMEWADIVIAACWASAIEIALQSDQVKSQHPAAFHLLSLAILLAFASFFVSKFIKSKFLVPAQVLEKFGVFFTATAFFIAITIPFPFCLKFASWAVYTISVLAILICSCF